MKRVFFITLLSLFLFKPVDAQSQKTSHFQINPLIKYRITESELKSRRSKFKAATYECTSYNELVSLITEKAKLRTTSYSIRLTYNFLFQMSKASSLRPYTMPRSQMIICFFPMPHAAMSASAQTTMSPSTLSSATLPRYQTSSMSLSELLISSAR